MAKKKAQEPATLGDQLKTMFVGAEEMSEDELNEMKYPGEDSPLPVETHPPATEEEAALRKGDAVVDEDKGPDKGDEVDEDDEKEPEKAEDKEESEEESEEEEPETAETAEAEEEETEEEEVDSEGQRIPYSRFKEVNDKLKEANERLSKLENAAKPAPEPEPQPEAPVFDFDAKEEAYMEAVLEGEKETAKAIRAEIRNAEIALARFEAEQISKQGDQTSMAKQRFEAKGAELEQEFPAIDMASEEYNAELREEALDLYVGYVNSGKFDDAAEALDKAVRQAVRNHGGAQPSDKVVDITKNTKKPDVKKKVAAQKQQPPDMKSRDDNTSEEPRVDINNMSDTEFNALPESAKRRLRGDFG